jgi:anaerobic selenocysteine-containing dehydrogenase
MLSLMAICGNIDVKGGNVFPVFPPGFRRHRELRNAGVARLPKEVLENQLGAKEFPLFSGPRALSPRCHKPTALKAMISGKPNAIKGIWGVANWLVSSESAKEAVEALKTLDFLVLYDFFMTPTTEYADMVLPATTWLERDEICDVSYPNYIVARQKAVEPLY